MTNLEGLFPMINNHNFLVAVNVLKYFQQILICGS